MTAKTTPAIDLLEELLERLADIIETGREINAIAEELFRSTRDRIGEVERRLSAATQILSTGEMPAASVVGPGPSGHWASGHAGGVSQKEEISLSGPAPSSLESEIQEDLHVVPEPAVAVMGGGRTSKSDRARSGDEEEIEIDLFSLGEGDSI